MRRAVAAVGQRAGRVAGVRETVAEAGFEAREAFGRERSGGVYFAVVAVKSRHAAKL